MGTFRPPLASDLLEIRDIIGFSADYIMQQIYQLKDEHEHEVAYTICSNLYRAERRLELELAAAGMDVKGRTYNPQSFRDVSYLEIKIDEVVEAFIDQHRGSGELAHYRKIL